MVYQRASSSFGAVSSRISLRADGAMSAIPISSGNSISPLCMCCESSIGGKLCARNLTYSDTKCVVKETHKNRNHNRNKDDNQCVRDCFSIAWPHNMREFFSHMLEVGEG